MRKAVLVSLDAFFDADFAQLRPEGGLSRMIREGSVCRQVKTVFPALTYPAHSRAFPVSAAYDGQYRFFTCWMPLLSMEVSPESRSSETMTNRNPFCWAVSMSTGR